MAFLGGPLHFLPELKQAFIRTLHLTPDHVVDPENSHIFAAMGAALEAGDAAPRSLDQLIAQLEQGVQMAFELKRLPPLFSGPEDYQAFLNRHSRAKVKVNTTGGLLSGHRRRVYHHQTGFDRSGGRASLVFLRQQPRLPHSDCHAGHGRAGAAASPEAHILRSCSTGYGETLLKSAFRLEEGEVETIAHYEAAAFLTLRWTAFWTSAARI